MLNSIFSFKGIFKASWNQMVRHLDLMVDSKHIYFFNLIGHSDDFKSNCIASDQ